MFNISAITLKEGDVNTKALADNDSKLSQIIKELKRVVIEDGKFQRIFFHTNINNVKYRFKLLLRSTEGLIQCAILTRSGIAELKTKLKFSIRTRHTN